MQLNTFNSWWKPETILVFEPEHEKTYKWYVHPAKTPISLHIHAVWSAFAWRSLGSQGPKVSSSGQQRLWSDCMDVQADPSLHWELMWFCWFYGGLAHLSLLLVLACGFIFWGPYQTSVFRWATSCEVINLYSCFLIEFLCQTKIFMQFERLNRLSEHLHDTDWL